MKTNFKIEKLKEKDLVSFYHFVKNFVLNEYDYPPKIRYFYQKHCWNKRKIEEYLKDKDVILIVAKENNEIIGFLEGFVDYGGSAWVDWLGVKREFRKKGIGTLLLEEAERFFKGRFCHFILCCTENMKLVNFYKKRGWYLVGLQKESFYGQDEYLLQKNIDKPHFELWR